MSSFRYWLVGFTFASAVVPLACAGILGDFANGASQDGGPSPDSGGSPPIDGSMPMPGQDGGSGADAPTTSSDGGGGSSDAQPTSDAPATLSPLTCLNPLGQPNWQGNPQLLYTVPVPGSGNNGTPVNNLYVEHLASQNAARVIAQINVPETDLAIFTAPEQNGQLQTALLSQIGLRGELRVPGAITLLIQPFSQGNDVVLYEIHDTDPGTNLDAGTGVASVAPPPDQSMNGGDFRLSFVQTPGDNYFTVAAYQSTTAGQYDLASWNSSKVWGQIPWDGTEMYVDSSPLILNGVEAYDFIGPPGAGGGGGPSPLSQYTFSLQSPTVSSPRLITSANGQAATIAIAPTVATAPANGYALAFVELTGAQSADIRAGIVAPSAIKTFMVSDLATLDFKPGGDAGFFDTTPFGGNGGVGARWMSNGDLGIMGAGGVGQGTSASTGVNFYVAAPTSADTIQWIIQTAGTGSNLFPGQSIGTIAFDVSQSTNDLVMTFDVAWAQPQADGTTAIFFNVLKCSI